MTLYSLPDEWMERLACVASEVDSLLVVRPPIVVWGRPCRQNRSIGFFSNDSIGYAYSNQIVHAQPLTDTLVELLSFVNALFGSSFNGILVNRYANGYETIGRHSDEEAGLDETAGVVCMSVGATRKFRIRNKQTGRIVIDIPTSPSKIIQMKGAFQREFTHEIPKETRVQEPRYSFTFRKHTN
jgi:alkylated DNA repair dioxygenase AlkB